MFEAVRELRDCLISLKIRSILEMTSCFAITHAFLLTAYVSSRFLFLIPFAIPESKYPPPEILRHLPFEAFTPNYGPMSVMVIFHQLAIASVWPTSPNFPKARFWITSEWPTIRKLSDAGSNLILPWLLSRKARRVYLLYPGRNRYGPRRVIKTTANEVANKKPTRTEP
jgi:hypothetical protein